MPPGVRITQLAVKCFTVSQPPHIHLNAVYSNFIGYREGLDIMPLQNHPVTDSNFVTLIVLYPEIRKRIPGSWQYLMNNMESRRRSCYQILNLTPILLFL